ncbi:hypothetical protein [Parapedobacter defluvii]|uniref:hypothetical protein n=1 Tax=Parapedobacter defluvii TaxID=2045106 RepID=UPI001667C68C|nr:hypothetical protein [Parapedobacter defluvii]
MQVLCFSPPSLTLPSGPIRICPAYISVKSPKSGTLAKSKRLHSGRKAHREGYGMELGSVGSDTGDRLEPASELSANSKPPRFGLVLLRPNQGTTKSNLRPNQGTTKLRSHPREYPVNLSNGRIDFQYVKCRWAHFILIYGKEFRHDRHAPLG